MGIHAIYRRVLLYILLGLTTVLTASGCARTGSGPGNSTVIQPGVTQQADLQRQLGEPLSKSTSDLRVGAAYWTYSDNQRFQIEKGTVVAHSRRPLPQEQTLQYWRHAWKGLEQYYAPVEGTLEPSGEQQMQLTAPKLNMSVIYSPSRDRILEVVKYGSH